MHPAMSKGGVVIRMENRAIQTFSITPSQKKGTSPYSDGLILKKRAQTDT